MFAGWGPMADLFYGVLVLLLENPETHKLLTREIRESFSSYGEIVPGKALMSLSYLHACIEESLRLLPSNNTGLPRISPGAVVDGRCIPKGVSMNLFTSSSSSVSVLLSSHVNSCHPSILTLRLLRPTYSPVFGL
jgi:cytochrome P450